MSEVKIKLMGNVASVILDITKNQFEAICKYAPEALKVTDRDENVIFRIINGLEKKCVHENTLSKNGMTINSVIGNKIACQILVSDECPVTQLVNLITPDLRLIKRIVPMLTSLANSITKDQNAVYEMIDFVGIDSNEGLEPVEYDYNCEACEYDPDCACATPTEEPALQPVPENEDYESEK